MIVTNAFLRSLARLDLAPSVVGALRQQAEDARAEGDEQGAQRADARRRRRGGTARLADARAG